MLWTHRRVIHSEDLQREHTMNTDNEKIKGFAEKDKSGLLQHWTGVKLFNGWSLWNRDCAVTSKQSNI